MIIGINDTTGEYGELVASIIQYQLSNSNVPIDKWLSLSSNIRNTYSKKWLIRRFNTVIFKIIHLITNSKYENDDIILNREKLLNIGKLVYSVSELYSIFRSTLKEQINVDVLIPILFDLYKEGDNWIISDLLTESEEYAIKQYPHKILFIRGTSEHSKFEELDRENEYLLHINPNDIHLEATIVKFSSIINS